MAGRRRAGTALALATSAALTALTAIAAITTITTITACGSDDPSGVPGGTGGDAAADAPSSSSDGGAKADGASFEAGTPCVLRDGGPDAAPYFDLLLDGVTKTAGEVNVSIDDNDRIQVTAGYPVIAQGASNSEVFFVRFEPVVGTGRCDDGAPASQPEYSAGYSYEDPPPNGPVTGAQSENGAGPCTMTITRAGDAGIVEGFAEGRLYNITAGRERTFEFRACWMQRTP